MTLEIKIENEKMRRLLILIDCQNDFVCKDGTMYVDGAEETKKNIEAFIRTNRHRLDNIWLSMDLHTPYSINFAQFWGTVLGGDVVEDGGIRTSEIGTVWKPVLKDLADTEDYNKVVSQYKENYEFLPIYPPHCICGTKGSNIDEGVMSAVMSWSSYSKQNFNVMIKGADTLLDELSFLNPVLPKDAVPDLETVGRIRSYDQVFVAGYALDYCVKAFFDSILRIKEYSSLRNLTLLADCTNAVRKTFDINNDKTFSEAIGKGMKIAKITNFINGNL